MFYDKFSLFIGPRLEILTFFLYTTRGSRQLPQLRNRALLQRCKKEDAKSPHDFPGMRMNNGWREWDSLDTLFESMGPNPMVMSEDLGPQVSRGYQHNSNIVACLWKETTF